MGKHINFDYEGKDYTLEFTRETVTMLERQGFMVDKVGSQPLTYLPMLFAGAFKAHHPSAKAAKIDEIFAQFTDKHGLLNALAEMYNEPLEALLVDEPEESPKNVVWGKSWGN